VPTNPGSVSDPLPLPEASPRTVISTGMERSFEAADLNHESARSFRNRLVVATFIVLIVAIGLLVFQWRLPKAIYFPEPADHPGLSPLTLTALVMIFGIVGALLTAIPAMSRIDPLHSPFNFPLPQAVLKIGLGSLTALIGVIVVGTSGVTQGFASVASLIGLAVVFGAGQQAVTQLLDKRANTSIAGMDK
jgi:hypothetical protein